MYTTTDVFNNAILGDNRKFLAKIRVGETEITEGIISIKHMMQSCSTTNITVGGAVSSYVEIEMWKPEVQLQGTEIEVSIGVYVSEESIEWVPLGLFSVQQNENDDGLLKFTAYDRIKSKLSYAYFSDLTYPVDGIQVLKEISRKTGVPIDTTGLPSGVMISQRTVITENGVDENGNSISKITSENPFNGYSYREALGYIAMLYCKFAVADRDGTIRFKWYTDVDYDINTDMYYDDLKVPENEFSVGQISCSGYNATFSVGTGEENIKLENPVMTQERLEYIYNQIKGFHFLPASVSFIGDMRLDTGDIVTVNAKDGSVVKIPVMSVSQEYDGGLMSEIRSYGGSTETTQTKSPILERLDRAYTELFLVKQIIGKKADFEYVHSIKGEFDDLSAKQAQFESATATNFKAVNARIDTVNASNITTENLKAKVAELGYLSAESADLKYALIADLTATTGKIDSLTSIAITTDNITAEVAKLGYATADKLEAAEAKIEYLETNKLNLKDLTTEVAKIGYLTADQANIRYAQIDFANVTGQVVGTSLIKDGAITDAKILGLSANKITAGVLDAGKITVTNLNATNITVGTLNGKLIGTGSVDLNKLAEEVPTKEYLDSVQNGLQDQIDNAIQTYSVSAIPTLTNYPASDWSSADYKKHIGDVCYVKNAGNQADGYTYRFEKNGDTYVWSLIKDSQVTEALQKLLNVDGELSGLKSFQSETSSWITKTDSELSSIKSRTTTIETTYSTKEEAKNLVSDAKKDLENALSTKVDTTTFNEVKQTVDTNSAQITQMTKTLEQKADGSTVESLQQTVNKVQQTANENVSKISQVSQSVERAQSTADDAKAYTDAVQNQSGYRYKTSIVVYGDRTDYYYPVYLAYGNQYVSREIMISRSYNEQAPDDWNVPTHKGGLTFRVKANYGGWGGAEYKCEILDFNQIYCTMVGDVRVDKCDGHGMCIWLRGGGTTGAIYHIYSDQQIEYRADQAKFHTAIPIIAYEGQKQIGWYGGSESSPDYTWISDNPLTTPDENHLYNLQALLTANTAKNRTETMSQTINEVKQTADSNSAKITQMNQTITQKADGSKVTALEERTSSVEQNLSGFKSEVSSTYTTKTEFENLEIGGRNLALNSADLTKWTVESGMKIEKEGDWFKVTSTSRTSERWGIYLDVPVEKNTVYTFSVYGKTGSVDAYCGGGPITNSFGQHWGPIPSESRIVETLSTADKTVWRIYLNICPKAAGHYAYFKLPKLEKGTKATDWTPAPEDMVSVSEFKTTIEQTNKKIELKVSKDGIISSINQTAETIKIDADKINLSGYVTLENLKGNGTTVIDGSNIKTGIISADRLDINSIFSNDITATGTISGGKFIGTTFEGASGTFSGSITASSGTIGSFTIDGRVLTTEYIPASTYEQPAFIYMGDTQDDGKFLKIVSRTTNHGDIESLSIYYNGSMEISNGNGSAIIGHATYPLYIPSAECYVGYDGNAKFGTVYTHNWFRSAGDTGWYNESHGGGIYMRDDSNVAVFGGKNFICDSEIYAAGTVSAGYSGNTGAERQVRAIAGAGTIYMYSQGNAGGNMGLYAAGRCSVFYLNSGNQVVFDQIIVANGSARICGGGHAAQMSSSGNWISLNSDGSSGGHGSLGSSGNYWSGVYYTSLNKISDKRKKRDLGLLSFEESLIILQNTKTVKYSMLDDSEDMVQYGVFAQDVRDMLIENNIGYRTMLNIGLTDGSEQLSTNLYESEANVSYSVDYLQFIAPLIKGWQYHNDELEETKQKYQALQGQYQSLQGQIEALRNKLHELEMAM